MYSSPGPSYPLLLLFKYLCSSKYIELGDLLIVVIPCDETLEDPDSPSGMVTFFGANVLPFLILGRSAYKLFVVNSGSSDDFPKAYYAA